MCCLEVIIAVLGIVVLGKDAIRFGGQECRGGIKNLIGTILIAQIVICLGFGFVVGFQEGLKAAKEGRSQPNMARMEKLQQQTQWVEVCVPIGACCLAGLLLFVGLKDPPTPKWDDEFGGDGRYPDDGYDDRYDRHYRDRDDRY